MSINKVMVYVFCVLMSTTVCAMEKELVNSQELTRSGSSVVMNKSSDFSVSPYTFSFSIPTVTEAVGSLTATYNNYMYNTEAFKKIGWPITDKIAQQETEKSQEIYKKALQNAATMSDYAFINRRQAICQRVLDELPDHPQGLQLALHCVQCHRAAMTPVDLTRFLSFIEEQREKSKKVDAEYSQLTILPEGDNQLLDNLFNQTLLVKNYSKEEEKKRKEAEEQKKKEEEEKKRKEEDKKKKQKEEEAKKNGKK